MTVFKGGSVNPINQSANKWNIAMGQTANRLQPVRQLNQSTRGHPLVTKRITRGAQSAAQKYNPNICANGKPTFAMCKINAHMNPNCAGETPFLGYSECGGPCQSLDDSGGKCMNPFTGMY